MKPAGDSASGDCVRFHEVHQVEPRAGLQDAMDFTQRRRLVSILQVMKHERREHPIEDAVWIRQLISEALIELERKRGAQTLALGASECPRIGVKPNHLDARILALGQYEEAARPAADVENAVTGANGRLFKEHRPGPVPAQQLHHRVI